MGRHARRSFEPGHATGEPPPERPEPDRHPSRAARVNGDSILPQCVHMRGEHDRHPYARLGSLPLVSFGVKGGAHALESDTLICSLRYS